MTHGSICFVCLGAWDSTMCLRARCFGKQLEKVGWAVHFLIPDLDSNRAVANESVHLVSSSWPRFFVQAKRLLRRLKPRYLHFLNPEFKAASLSLLNFGSRIIGDWEDWHAFDRDRGIKKWITRSCDGYMRYRCDYVLVTSKWLKSKFTGLTKSSPYYIPYAVLPRQFPDLPNPFSQPTAVFMGSFHSHLDHDVLLSAALELKRNGSMPAIRMIGRGADWDRSLVFCQKHGLSNVELTGYLDWDEMLNNLRWAHVLLFPIRDKVTNKSRCPFKVIQYAQARRPIITSAVGEVTTFLEDKVSYIESTPESFATAIRQSMEQPRSPDIDYEIEKHAWESRTKDFLLAIDCFSNETAARID